MEREQGARAEALDLQRAAELPAERVEHPVRRDEKKRNVGDGHGRSDERQHRRELTLAGCAPAPPGDADERDEDGRIELDDDPDPDDEGAGAEPAGDEKEHRAGDERRRNEVEARQDHTAEEKWDERDDKQREAAVGLARAEPTEAGGEEEHADRPGHRHLRGEHHAVGAERVGHERGQNESRKRPRRVLEREVAVGDEPVRDSLAVRSIERDIGDGAPAPLPRDGRRHGREDEHGGGGERLPLCGVAVPHVDLAVSRGRASVAGSGRGIAGGRAGLGSRGRKSASSTNGSTQGR